ncbi:hypothetical protein SLEP1_g3679 [Rubroshorea leprosula]|uniref:Uncharacterized protein n=1 Tax=Rubroshorea leprosula TaxID=152421 RepID=A0AAV5HLP8_9ROSI|nr:hypothetical protein SLEP1_g3679 [Rubroshorea leprosula]
MSALFSFLPAAEHHQPFPAPSFEKLVRELDDFCSPLAQEQV